MAKGKIKSPRSIARKLSSARVFLDNAQKNAEIGKMIALFGYKKTKLTEGQKLLEDTENTVNEFEAKYGRQLTITKKLDQKWDATDEKFAVTRKVASILFGKDAGDKRALALIGDRSKALPVWIRQAKTLYSNLLKSKRRLEKMAEHNFTKAKLQAEYNQVKEVEKLDSKQESLKGDAQRGTKIRNKKIKELDDWMGKARKFARLALAEKPQLLEKLGITIES